jgi:hypothetical protein
VNGQQMQAVEAAGGQGQSSTPLGNTTIGGVTIAVTVRTAAHGHGSLHMSRSLLSKRVSAKLLLSRHASAHTESEMRNSL